MNRYFKHFSLLILTVFLIYFGCQKDEISQIETTQPTYINAQTVSFKEAKAFFTKKQKELTVLSKTTTSKKDDDLVPLNLIPDWNSLSQNNILFSEALLTKANVTINRPGKYESQLYFVKKDGAIKNVIFTIFKDKIDANGDVIDAYLFFNELDGTFIDAYKIENGVFRKKLVPKKDTNVQKATMFLFFQNDPQNVDDWSWCDNGIGGPLEETVVIARRSGGAPLSTTSYFPQYGNYGHQYSSNGVINSSGASISASTISAATAALMLQPIPVDPSIACEEGFVKNANGHCVPEPPKTKCESLKRLVSKDSVGSNILPVVNQLREKLKKDKEWSISYRNKWINGIRKNVPDGDIKEGISKTRSHATTGTTYVGQIHTHPENTYPIFSWLDLRVLRNLYKNSHEDFNEYIFLMIVAPNNITYTLKVDDFNTLNKKIEDDWSNAKGKTKNEKEENIEKILDKKFRKSNNLEQTFLKLFGSHGISLYKATDSNLSNWTQLTLDKNDDKIVKEINCN